MVSSAITLDIPVRAVRSFDGSPVEAYMEEYSHFMEKHTHELNLLENALTSGYKLLSSVVSSDTTRSITIHYVTLILFKEVSNV